MERHKAQSYCFRSKTFKRNRARSTRTSVTSDRASSRALPVRQLKPRLLLISGACQQDYKDKDDQEQQRA
jgi:hypothetical protein